MWNYYLYYNQFVKKLKQQQQTEILNRLSAAVTDSDRKRGKLHQVFESSFDAKECRRAEFINQKLCYMHENPCKGVWNLAASPSEYLHSSALFYQTGKNSIYEVTNYKALEDINLTEKWTPCPYSHTKARKKRHGSNQEQWGMLMPAIITQIKIICRSIIPHRHFSKAPS